MVDDSLSRTGASLLIDALQKNGINNLYGVVGIPITDLARLAELKGMKYYGFRREDSAVDYTAALWQYRNYSRSTPGSGNPGRISSSFSGIFPPEAAWAFRRTSNNG